MHLVDKPNIVTRVKDYHVRVIRRETILRMVALGLPPNTTLRTILNPSWAVRFPCKARNGVDARPIISPRPWQTIVLRRFTMPHYWLCSLLPARTLALAVHLANLLVRLNCTTIQPPCQGLHLTAVNKPFRARPDCTTISPVCQALEPDWYQVASFIYT